MISQNALTAIHWVHRNFAFIVFAYLGTLGWRMLAEPGLRGPARLLLILLAAQLLTGLTTIFFQWPQIGRAHVELQSLMRISYAVFCLKKKKTKTQAKKSNYTQTQ